MRLQMDNPSPVPPLRVVKKGLYRSGIRSGLIPRPVSDTESVKREGIGKIGGDGHSPLFLDGIDGVQQEIEDDLLNFVSIHPDGLFSPDI